MSARWTGDHPKSPLRIGSRQGAASQNRNFKPTCTMRGGREAKIVPNDGDAKLRSARVKRVLLVKLKASTRNCKRLFSPASPGVVNSLKRHSPYQLRI